MSEKTCRHFVVTKFDQWANRPWVEFYYRCDCGQVIFSSKDFKRFTCLQCRKETRP